MGKLCGPVCRTLSICIYFAGCICPDCDPLDRHHDLLNGTEHVTLGSKAWHFLVLTSKNIGLGSNLRDGQDFSICHRIHDFTCCHAWRSSHEDACVLPSAALMVDTVLLGTVFQQVRWPFQVSMIAFVCVAESCKPWDGVPVFSSTSEYVCASQPHSSCKTCGCGSPNGRRWPAMAARRRSGFPWMPIREMP